MGKRTNTPRKDQAGEKKAHKVVYGIVERGEQSFWTRIGVAFVNADYSLNVVLNFVPTDPSTRIQIRDPKAEDESDES